MRAERKRGEIRGEVRTQGASSCDLVSCVRAESELWLQALLGPQPWGRRLSAMWLTVPMKLASPAKLQSDAEFPQAVLRKNGTWRTASYKNPSGRRHTVFEAFTGGITRRKISYLWVCIFSFLLIMAEYIQTTRLETRTLGHYCFLHQGSLEVLNRSPGLQADCVDLRGSSLLRASSLEHGACSQYNYHLALAAHF